MFEPITVVAARVDRREDRREDRGEDRGEDRREGRRRVSSEELAEHEGLVRWVVRRQWLGDLPFEDAVQAGRIGLWHALQGYDATKGTRFSTYAVVAIKRAVWKAVAEHQAPRSTPPLCASPLRLDPARPLGVDLPDLAEQLHRREVHAELIRLIGTLPPRLRLVVLAHYGLGCLIPQTFAEIGQSLGITRQRVQQLHVEALLSLGQPAHSLSLRALLERGRRLDYQRTRERQAQWRQLRRGTRRGHARRALRSHAR